MMILPVDDGNTDDEICIRISQKNNHKILSIKFFSAFMKRYWTKKITMFPVLENK